jgi:hypothetical protein
MPNASSTLMTIFRESKEPLTMHELLPLAESLKKSEISMALCYLLKQGYLSREKVERRGTRGRKEIWCYQFHADRQREQRNEQNEN